jgi:hypothetical protein
MATCTITGTIVDPTGTGISGATIELRVTSPQFDASNSLVVPYTSTVTTNSSGVFTLTADQGISAIVTIDYPPNATDSVRRYAYSVLVPSSSSTNFSTIATEL